MTDASAHLQASPSQKVLTWMLALVVPPLLALFLGIQLARTSTSVALCVLAVLPMLLSLTYLRVVTEFSITERELNCRSLWGTRRIPIEEIRLIDARPGNRGLLIVKSTAASIYTYRNMPGALQALVELQRQNPNIKVLT